MKSAPTHTTAAWLKAIADVPWADRVVNSRQTSDDLSIASWSEEEEEEIIFRDRTGRELLDVRRHT